ncbi:hypothetical protein [Streptomyces sp. SID4985]|uniref:hypothetical protein n=1 Tax=unclassified Streptomyces TaxID=2593676 RepID=UPI00136EB8DE|nr:hypothetical protein [Streptomyces sp. SID4985]MYQ48869.1 hypothetical protein [Streptomyces sp. SID4985]
MSDASASPAESGQPVLSSAQTAVADMRATARWTIGATAAVGGVLLAGVPLAAIGKVHGARDIALAAGGLLLALAGVAWAIWQTGEALSPRFVTLASLDEPGLDDLRARIAAQPRAFLGPFGTSAAELAAACTRHSTVAARLEDLLAREEDPRRRAEATHRLAQARANFAEAAARRRSLLELIHAWEVRNVLRRARLHTLIAAVVVVAGAVLFITATRK